MGAVTLELKRSAKWCAWLTIPIFFFGLLLLDPHGNHIFQFTGTLGLLIIYPWALIHDSGFQYRLGNLVALPLIAISQWVWFLIPVHCFRVVLKYFRQRRGSN